MLKISRFTVENMESGCVTDNPTPRFSFSLTSDRKDVVLREAVLQVNGWTCKTTQQIAIAYGGPALQRFTCYTARLRVMDNYGEEASAELSFETGRRGKAWTGKWISDPQYSFTEKKTSPKPMLFRKSFFLAKPVKKAKIYATAMGVYELELDGKKVGDQYFAPGFTSYRHVLQYQTYDVTEAVKKAPSHELLVTVAGGWAVGAFVFTRINRHDADRQALLLELRAEYEDGTEEVIGSDETFEVTTDGPVKMAEFYDGETFDACCELSNLPWHAAAPENLKITPEITADYGSPVKAHERMTPVSVTRGKGGELIYDFGQNFAGVVDLEIDGHSGQTVIVKHAEILNPDGSLNTTFLRSAKATATYICREGKQRYSPRFTYMGFRYISIEGIEQEKINVSALALYSDLRQTGEFSCSDERLNRLQQNILWGSKSNLVDIPTDCPQRDERMGWTGDIAVFAPTACFNFDMARFLEKWLRDVKAEQYRGGGIPNTVPAQGYGFPATMPPMAVDWWDDACILVPWALYMASGDKGILEKMYPTMKKYVKACRFWAGLLSFGKNRYIWHTPSVLHFGDWVAPDVPKMSQWQARSKWTATASLKSTSSLLAKIAGILGNEEDEKAYAELAEKVSDAYCSVFTDGEGKLKEEFQTGYVLPLYLDMFPDEQTKQKAADNLKALVEKGDYCIGTGFPGTPYILFVLADNGHEDTAYRMLMNTKCPSWLYEVKAGATTIWERWDGLDENGVCPIGDDGTDIMISYNHYASGAVGDFLYRRVAGLEPIEPGYRRFRVKPLPGGGLTSAKASVETPYGTAGICWELNGEELHGSLEVPACCTAELELPGKPAQVLGSGTYEF